MNSIFFELEKIAYAPNPSILRRMGGLVSAKLPSAKNVKQFFIGQPRRFAHEVRTGKTLEPGGMLRESFSEGLKDPLSVGLMYGLPAYETVNIATDTEGNKGSRIGGLLGGTALGMGLWKPLGFAGSSIAGLLGESAGSTLGSIGEKPKRRGLLQPK